MHRFHVIPRKNDLGRVLCITLIALACTDGRAGELPIVGVLEQFPVMPDDLKVVALPTYIFTDRQLSAPTVFSGFVGMGTTLTVVCCFEVKNTTPTSLDAELAKYGKDAEFVDRMKSVKGYHYVYAAQSTVDKQRWTPLMKTLARNTANPDDAAPFSVPVVAAQFDKPIISTSFTANSVPMTLQTHIDRKSDRIIYTFTRGSDKVKFSQNGFAD